MHFAHASFTGTIGYGQAEITPPAGIYSRNWGAAAHDVATGVHRPLHARVLSLQTPSQASPFFLVSLDLGWWKLAADEWLIRGALLSEFGIDETQALINLTHTHAGPVFCSGDVEKPGGALIPRYLETLCDAVLTAARAALDGSTPATLEWATGRCTLARHRDLPDPQAARTVCGFNPAREADDTLLVGRVTNESGALRCVLANYACHATTLAWQNTLISPDWVGGYYDTIEKTLGVPAMFLQGASGELQPRDAYTGDVQIADAQGRQFAHSMLSTLEGMLPPRTRLEYGGVVESGAPLAVWQRVAGRPQNGLRAAKFEVELPLKEMESAAELRHIAATCEDRVLRERAVRKMRVRQTVGDGQSAQTPLWLWEVGEAVLIAHREEAYSTFQRALREQFPTKTIIVLNLTNGSCGYVPPAPLYDLDIYQVWQTPYARGCAEMLLQAAQERLDQLINTVK